MTIVFAWGEASGNDVAPQLTLQRQAEQFTSSGIGFAHDALRINDDCATGQQVEEL
ncbi:hypothetical protein D3C73_1505380 [compost metagenome]